jgi:hypothetical protein
MAGAASAQKDPVNALFVKYNGVAGFTTVNITGDMLKLITQVEAERRDSITFASSLSEIRILAIEKGCDKPAGINLRSELYDQLDKSVYKEMVSVKKEGEDLVILMKENKGRIAEILILAGGDDENALIQIKGDMLLSEMADMAGKYQMQGFEHLKKLEK